MIVKITILRLLGSSDDKEKEKIGVARPEEPVMSIGASDGCRKNRRHGRRESKTSQLIGTE